MVASDTLSVAEDAADSRTSVFRNRPLITLCLGHMTIDMYGGLLPVLYPVLSGKFDLTLATVGLVSLAYSGMGSISQPLFGWLADRYGTRLTGAALIWTAASFAAIAFAPSFPDAAGAGRAGRAGVGRVPPVRRAERQRRHRRQQAQRRDVGVCLAAGRSASRSGR